MTHDPDGFEIDLSCVQSMMEWLRSKNFAVSINSFPVVGWHIKIDRRSSGLSWEGTFKSIDEALRWAVKRFLVCATNHDMTG